MTQQAMIPVCRREPLQVWEMTVGDSGYVMPYAILCDRKAKAFIMSNAALKPFAPVKVWRDCKGIHADWTAVSGKVRRELQLTYPVKRLKSVRGVECKDGDRG